MSSLVWLRDVKNSHKDSTGISRSWLCPEIRSVKAGEFTDELCVGGMLKL
jgi:phage terminase large subunit